MNELALAPTSLPEADPLEFIVAAAAAGYDGVGLRLVRSPGLPFRPVLDDPPLVREIKRTLSGSGLRVLDILSFYLEPDTSVAAFEPALEASAEFGARYVLVMGADPDWDRQRDSLIRFHELASRFGLVCALEAAVMRPLADLPGCLRLIEQSGCDDAVICLDPLNFVRAGGKAADLRGLDPALFPYAQLTDGVLGPGEPDPALLGHMGPNQRRMIGEGDVPLAELLDALPPNLPLSVETPDMEQRGYSPKDWARITYDNARAFLARYDNARAEHS
ncbi:MAG: sugar phosphate isomerase/epimerase [Alphaproteobacteria bacterium]|nr:sugar phosphate isomerase/epimerase [Alphaproteobacteria bacterium]